jgi:ABC-type transport system involved in multi-copper enzyme maturation permease subunit
MMVDMGLSSLLAAGMLLGVFGASGILSAEIENKTVLTVVSKPIGRPAFVIGKYLGLLGALAAAFLIWTFVFLLGVRHGVVAAAYDEVDGPVLCFGFGAFFLATAASVWGNYFYRWIFPPAFTAFLLPLLALAYLLVLMTSREWGFQPPWKDLPGQVLLAVLLVFQSVMILAALALAATTRLRTGPTLLLCAFFFLAGVCGEYFISAAGPGGVFGLAAQLVLPNLQLLWLADALTQQHPVTADYVLLASGYALLYTVAVLATAVLLFQKREAG